MTLPVVPVPGLPTPTPPRHPQSGDGVDEGTLDVRNAVTTAEQAVRAIDAIVRELAQTIAAIRILAANDRTRTAPGVEAATNKFSEAARLLQDMAEQSALLARQLMPMAARVDSKRPVDDRRDAAASASARSITNIANQLRDLGGTGCRTIVSGAAPQCGTTLTALALARVLARECRVVLVELPQAMPKLASLTLDASAFGVAEWVRGTASFDQVISRDRVSALHVMTAGRVDADRWRLLAADRVKLLLDALARSYDQVVIDAGAVSEAGRDAWAQLADRVVLLGVASAQATRAANNALIAAGFKDITVLNAADSHRDAPKARKPKGYSDRLKPGQRRRTNRSGGLHRCAFR
jgi:Mrp family chromosome partitioning ATPase